MKIDNKKILIGAGILVVGYLAYEKFKPKKCVKWSQEICKQAPCNQTCEEYK